MNRKLKVLIIDDTARYASSIKDFLEILGHEVIVKHLPKDGIETMNHTFDVVFIDHIYDNDESMNGADVGWAIRQKYSLAALIMITGYWSEPENIRQFIWVGFDSFLPKHKEGDSIDDINRSREEALQTALNNAQRRIKSKFTEAELLDARATLDRFEAVAKLKNHGLVIFLAPGEHILRIDPSFYDSAGRNVIDDRITEFKELIRKASAEKKFEFLGKEVNKQSSINLIFKVYAKGLFVAKEPALKMRQLFIENPISWPNFRKCSPSKAFISSFNID